METVKKATAYRLSDRARELLAQLKAHTGKNFTAILEEAIRDYAKKNLKNTL